MAEMGRPRVLTPELKKEILEYLELGLPKWAAAEAAGIHRDTLHAECQRDQDFSDDVKRSDAQCMVFHCRRVKAAPANWQASMTLMERKWPKDWGRRVHIETMNLPGDTFGTAIKGELGEGDNDDG